MKDMMPEYVDELKDYDIDMLEHNLDKNAKDYNAGAAPELLFKTLKKLGVDISESEESVDAAMKKNGVKVEHRTNYDDTWRNGTYIYKGMDLAGFISEPLFKKPGFFDINRSPSVVVRAALQ